MAARLVVCRICRDRNNGTFRIDNFIDSHPCAEVEGVLWRWLLHTDAHVVSLLLEESFFGKVDPQALAHVTLGVHPTIGCGGARREA